MLNIIYKDFKNYLEFTFPDIKIDEYRGEFEEKFSGGWNPGFPCCLIKLDEYAPAVRAASHEIIKHKTEFTLYVAEKNSPGFDLIQLLIDDLNDTTLEFQEPFSLPVKKGYCVEVNTAKFFKMINSVRVHTLSISIS